MRLVYYEEMRNCYGMYTNWSYSVKDYWSDVGSFDLCMSIIKSSSYWLFMIY